MKIKGQMLKSLAVVVGVVLLAQVVPAEATEVTLGSDRQGMVQYRNSTRFYKNGTAVSTGTYFIPVSEDYYYRRSLIAFDLSSLTDGSGDPIYSSIDSLTLKITLIGNVSDGPENSVSMYAVSQDNGDWDFDTSALAVLSAAAWDHESSMLATHTFPTAPDSETGVLTLTISGTDLTALMDSWVNGNNAGFVLVGYEPAVPDATNSVQAGYVFGSQELVVGYTPIPEPATMAMLGLGGVMMLIRRRRNIA